MISDIIEEGDTIVIDKRQYNGTPKVGREGEVVGFETIYHGRTSTFPYTPGQYLNRSKVRVRVDMRIHTVSSIDLRPADEEEYEHRERAFRDRQASMKTTQERFQYLEDKDRVGPLPESELWEGDVVSAPALFEDPLFVRHVKYRNIEAGRHHFYELADSPFGSRTYLLDDDSDIELVDRGIVWKWHHDEEIDFDSLKQEALLHRALGRYNEIENPYREEGNPPYSWTKKQVLRAIVERHGDCSYVRSSLSDGHFRTDNVIRFLDRDLGGRVASRTLELHGS